MKILFIRHGQTQDNLSGKVPNQNDPVKLTKLGQDQARKLSNFCRTEKVEAVITSKERRAVQTGTIIAEALGLKAEPVECWHERDWGEWAGRTWMDINAGITAYSIKQRYTFVPPRGESWQQMDERVDACLAELLKRSYKVAAVVTHGGVLRHLVAKIKGEQLESSLSHQLSNGSVTIFEFERDGKTKLLRENYVPE